MTTVIEWHDAAKELPAKSGLYMTNSCWQYVNTLEYSSKHKLFNARDELDREGAEKNAINVKWWAEAIDFPDDEVADNG